MVTTPQLSYAAYFDDPLKRTLVRMVERLSGQPRLQKLYDRYRSEMADQPFFDCAISLLDLQLEFDAARLADIPATGPLVVVVNHPYGVLDGLTICWLISQRRTDFKVLTNAVLDGAPEARDWLLPIDFAPTKEAQAVNLATRADCLKRLGTGECIIVFPAGGVSTSPTPFARAAVDDPWKPFTASLITRTGASVTPVFFEGQNSRLFQRASHISLELRLAMIFREVRRRMGSRLTVQIGKTLQPMELQTAGKRQNLISHLRTQTYSMAPASMVQPIARAEKLAEARRLAGRALW